MSHSPTVVILSGGPNSVHVDGAPTVPPGFFEHCVGANIPILGICYGMQLIVQCLGGEVKPAVVKEYGRMPIHAELDSTLYGAETDARCARCVTRSRLARDDHPTSHDITQKK